MRYLKQFFIILLFYALGTLAANLIGDLIPGSVMGMFLLFLAIRARVIKPSEVRDASYFLTSIMGFLFIPAGVGLVTQLPLLRQYWHIIVLAMVLSTIMVMSVVGLAQQRFEYLHKRSLSKKTASTKKESI